MSHLRRGLVLGSRGCTIPSRASLPRRSSAPGPNPTNSFHQQRRYNNQPLSSNCTLSKALPGTGKPKLSGDAGSISRSSSTSTSSNTSRRVSSRSSYMLPWIRPTMRYSPGSSSDGGASNRRRVGFLSDKNTTTYYVALSCRRFAGRARDDLGLPNSASSSSGDGATLLRRVATYIEEDPRAAEKLGEAVRQCSVTSGWST